MLFARFDTHDGRQTIDFPLIVIVHYLTYNSVFDLCPVLNREGLTSGRSAARCQSPADAREWLSGRFHSGEKVVHRLDDHTSLHLMGEVISQSICCTILPFFTSIFFFVVAQLLSMCCCILSSKRERLERHLLGTVDKHQASMGTDRQPLCTRQPNKDEEPLSDCGKQNAI